jgi:5-methyltetrahydropteroyltriglutamate--homocysteine methyltransferase
VKRSTDRILTSHSGSLIRTREVIEGMKAVSLNQPYDRDKLAADVRAGVKEVVRKQVEVGIDIPNDGEYWRHVFHGYIHERLSGLEPRSLEPGEVGTSQLTEREKFPGFYEQYQKHQRALWMLPGISTDDLASDVASSEWFRLTGPITYTGHAAVQRDIETLRYALQGLNVADAFITAVTPVSRKLDKGILDYYASERAYLYALADAMEQEYKAITDAGFIVQLDFAALNPHEQLLKGHTNLTADELQRAIELGIEVTNHALRNIPTQQVRYHHCWGSMNRPHTEDVPLREFVHQMLKIKAQAYGVEAANPRHEHEWMVWKDVKLPDSKILIPGLISQSTNVVEHPELVAWRIKNFASVVGKENLIAGVDCGFSQSWELIRVHPTVQWAKLQSLVDGAALASRELWHSEVPALSSIR